MRIVQQQIMSNDQIANGLEQFQNQFAMLTGSFQERNIKPISLVNSKEEVFSSTKDINNNPRYVEHKSTNLDQASTVLYELQKQDTHTSHNEAIRIYEEGKEDINQWANNS